MKGSAIASIGMTAILALSASPLGSAKPKSEKETKKSTALKLTPDFAKIAKDSRSSIVNIFTLEVGEARQGKGARTGADEEDIIEKFFDAEPFDRPQRQSLGSGFIISEAGDIVTNAHLVDRAFSINVVLSEEDTEYPARVVGTDGPSDVALLRINAKRKFSYLKLGDSESVEVGDWVLAVGNPFGFTNTATQGIVSARGRELVPGGGRRGFGQFIQTDAHINPGNSGGPLLNSKGEVIGINTAIATSSTGIGFAIPINSVRSVISQLKEKGRVVRGYLGVSIQTLTPVLAEGLGISARSGALITNVVPQSPADQAGLKNRDIVTEYDGRKVASAEFMHELVAKTTPGSPFKVRITRGSENLVKTIALTELKEKVEVPNPKPTPTNGFDILGLKIEDTLPYGSGVTINNIKPEGPAFKAGLLFEDIIYEVNLLKASEKRIYGTKIKSGDDYKSLLKQIKTGDTVTFLLNRSGTPLYIAFKLN